MRSSLGFEDRRATGRAPKPPCAHSRPWGATEAMGSSHRPVIPAMLQGDKKKKKKQEVTPGNTKDTTV